MNRSCCACSSRVQGCGSTLFAVSTVAFVTLPHSLGHIPGDPAVLAQADGLRHLT